MRRGLALIRKAGRKDARQKRIGIVGIVAIISLPLARELHMPGMVIVVVPLGAVSPVRRISLRIEKANAIVVVLQHQMQRAPARCRQLSDCEAHLLQQCRAARLRQRMRRIEPQPVEPIMREPLQGVFDRKGPHLRILIIDGLAPGRVRRHEELRRIAAEIIPLWPEMIVDHVEKEPSGRADALHRLAP
jgi:hypothetical protein